MGHKKESITIAMGCGADQTNGRNPRKRKSLQARIVIHSHIIFDATGEVEVHGEVKPASTDDTPREVCINGWMTDTFGYTGDCSGCAAKRAGMNVAKTQSAAYIKCSE